MPDTQSPLIIETLLEALETMAFIALMPSDNPDMPPQDTRLVTIAFTRPDPGSISLVAPAALGALLVSNLLGVDPSDPDVVARADDALCELLNITCGALLRKYAESSPHSYHMIVPQIRAFDPAGWAEFIAQNDTHVLDADGHTIAIRTDGIE